MTVNEFKALKIGDMVVTRANDGQHLVLMKVGPSHYRQGLGEKEMFSYFMPMKGKKIQVIRSNRQIIYKVEFNA